MLNSINASTMKGETRTQFTELRTHFAQLETTWRAQTPAGRGGANEPAGHVSGHVERGTTGTTGAGDWMSHYTAIDQTLSRMSSTDAKLMEFRKHLEAFHQAAMSASSTPRGAVDQPAPDLASDNARQQIGVGIDPDVQQTPRDAGRTIQVAPGQTIGLSAAATTADDATITRLSAMIDEMLRGRASANSATGTTGSAGATAGTVCVDRAQLEQLRTMIDGLRSSPR